MSPKKITSSCLSYSTESHGSLADAPQGCSHPRGKGRWAGGLAGRAGAGSVTGPPEPFFPHSGGGGPGRWDPRSGSFSCGPLAEGDGMGLGRRGALVGIRLRWSRGLGVFLVEMGLFITTMSIPLSFPARSSEETTARSSGGEGAAAGGGGAGGAAAVLPFSSRGTRGRGRSTSPAVAGRPRGC